MCRRPTPRTLTDAQRRALSALARHVVAVLELRQHARALQLAHRRLREADRLKDEVIARVSHELRTPVASISGYLELLSDGSVDSGEFGAFLEIIQRNSQRLVSLVDDMLLSARLSTAPLPVQLEPVDLARAAVERNRSLAQCRDLTICVE